jgi:hypothetical protein
MISLSQPRVLIEAWATVLLAPIAWATALGGLYSLTDETCAQGGRLPMDALAAACLVLTIIPAPIAWIRGRHTPADSNAGERARFLFNTAVGLSALFALVTLMTAIPIFLLDPCRT